MSPLTRRQFVQSGASGLLAARLPFGFDLDAISRGFQSDPSLERRKEYLALLQRLLSPTTRNEAVRLNAQGDKTWEEWLKRTGALPPDFLTMPSRPFIPDPLVMLDDANPAPIHSVGQWQRQRRLIRARFEEWIVGRMPPAPGNVRPVVLETRQEGDTTVQRIRLEFGPDHRATLRLQLLIPPGKGPFPVLVTNHQRGRPWVNAAIRRGYAGCIYQAIDRGYGVEDDSEKWLDVYPEYDFGAIARWAWGGMRAVDYLVTLPMIDQQCIAIGGHSRNSKQALLAAAFDTRIGAVVASRGNTGDALPWRFTEDLYQQESIEELTDGFPGWFHPRLRFFVGREHKLPVDQNLLLALVAPRGLLVSHAFMEHQGNPLGVEQAYRSVKQVYRLLGSEQKLGLYQQPGEHPSSAEDVDQYFDFFDTVFGRHRYPVPEIFVHGYSFEQWKFRSREQIDPLRFPVRPSGPMLAPTPDPDQWDAQREDVRRRLRWTLGEAPPGVPMGSGPGTGNRMTSEGWRGQFYNRPGVGYDATTVAFGDDLQGYLYRPPRPPVPPLSPADSARAAELLRNLAAPPSAGPPPAPPTNWPVVIWLHRYSYATGFSRYLYWGPLYQRGFAVIAFDQIGFGARNQYSLRFYDRHPRWSLLGKMVADTRAVVDAIVTATAGRFDPSRIYLCGYGLGAKVGLMTAALDDRVAGVTASAGFSPLRSRRTKLETEGVRHYSHIHGLLPRLGFFLGNEERIPVDYDEIITAIAPRPVQIVAPTMDRHAPVEEVRRTVDDARPAFARLDRSDALQLETPEDFNRFPAVWMKQIDWVTRQAGLVVPPP